MSLPVDSGVEERWVFTEKREIESKDNVDTALNYKTHLAEQLHVCLMMIPVLRSLRLFLRLKSPVLRLLVLMVSSRTLMMILIIIDREQSDLEVVDGLGDR